MSVPEDSISPLPASVGAPLLPRGFVRGHRASSIMGSMDLAEEAMDTVDAADSEAWYPRFVAASSQPLAAPKKLDQTKQSGLGELLAKRMEKSMFETRFLGGAELSELRLQNQVEVAAKTAAKETSGESLFNRSAKLGALLANRPDKQRLESLNIMKSAQGGSASSSSGKFAGMQAKLDASQRRDKLNSLLSARPAQETLVRRGLLLDVAVDQPRERLASARTTLGDFFASRPNPAQLVAQKIITDVGDLPGGLERKQENQLVPARVCGALEGKKVVSVSLGFSHTIALDDQGVVYVFGNGSNGRLGFEEGSFSDVLQATALPASHFGGEAVASVDAGENHTAVLTRSGQLYTFGTGAWGRLGLGNQDDQTLPQRVSLPAGEVAARVSCGAYHTLVLSRTSKLYAFGWNKNGRCGLGRKHPTLLVLTPTEVPFFSEGERTVVEFEAGAGASFARTSQGETYLWGAGSFGALGFGDEADVWEPKLLDNFAFSSLALGHTHALAASPQGGAFSWGGNDKGQLGRPAVQKDASGVCKTFFVPGAVTLGASSPSVRSLAAGKSHSLFATNDGAVYACGLGARGLLGVGDEADAPLPVLVNGLSGVGQVDASWTHSAAVTTDGALYTWGAKKYCGL